MKTLLKPLALFALAFAIYGGCVPVADKAADSVAPKAQAEIEGLELPVYDDTEDILTYTGYTSSYNHQTLVPNWVAYELTAEEANGTYKAECPFSRDFAVKGRQASREDYSHSGWDKGHMAPKADMKWSEQAFQESFFFPNICPQNHVMNEYDWGTVEKKARAMARRYGKVYIVCGPMFTTHEFGTIGSAKVAVPDAFFKALLIPVDGTYQAVAFVMPNKPERHDTEYYAMSVDQLEAQLGRDLFWRLPDDVEEPVEAVFDWNFWK